MSRFRRNIDLDNFINYNHFPCKINVLITIICLLKKNSINTDNDILSYLIEGVLD